PEIEDKGEDEEENRRVDGGLAEHIRGVRPKRRLGRAATKGCTHAAVFRLLRQHDQDEEDRHKDQHDRQDSEENAHVKDQKSSRRLDLSIWRFLLCKNL